MFLPLSSKCVAKGMVTGVLGDAGGVAVDGEVREVGAQIGQAELAGMDELAGFGFMKVNKIGDVIDVLGFGVNALLLEAQKLAKLIQQFGTEGSGWAGRFCRIQALHLIISAIPNSKISRS